MIEATIVNQASGDADWKRLKLPCFHLCLKEFHLRVDLVFPTIHQTEFVIIILNLINTRKGQGNKKLQQAKN